MTAIQIPHSEYRDRWRRIQDQMDKDSLDLLLVYSDDHSLAGPANVRYISNFPAHFEPTCILMRRAHDPILLTGPESHEYARLRSEVADVRIVKEFAPQDEEYPYTKLRPLRDIVCGVAGRATNIGIAGLNLMPAKIFELFRRTLKARQILDAESLLSGLRTIKSRNELNVIQEAYRIAEKGIEACLSAIEVGRMESEVAAEGEYAMRCMGAEGTAIDTIVASGPNTRPILARTTSRRIRRNELVLVTIGPRFQGYNAAIGRPIYTGKPPPDIERSMTWAVAAQSMCRETLRPGVVGRDAEGTGRRFLEEKGLGKYFVYAGIHSVGLVEFEPPIMSPKSNHVIQPDMVLSIDIPLFLTPWGDLRYEDGFKVTKKGAVPLDNVRTGALTTIN